MTEKTIIRKQMRGVMNSISDEELRSASDIITDNILDFIHRNNFESIFCYISFGKEIITNRIIDTLLAENYSVYVPVTIGDDMIASKISINTEYRLNSYGIKEPVIIHATSEEIDCALIPGVAFDRACSRLGHGKGYYDKWLQKNHPVKVGIFGSWQQIDEVPKQQHDVVLDAIISEKDTILSLQVNNINLK